MFVGDCGLGIGSRIKGYMRYGGHWKPLKHNLYTSVYITSKHNTFQTCIYYFQKLSHSVQTVYKNGARRLRTINGAFICDNPNCVSAQAKNAVKGRDTLSAMAIGLFGLATLLFNATFPQFDPQVSQSNTDEFKRMPLLSLLQTKTGMLSITVILFERYVFFDDLLTCIDCF